MATRLIIDVDQKKIVTTAGATVLLTAALAAKRGDSNEFECQYVQNGSAIELAGGTTFIFGVKPKTALRGSYLVSSQTFVKTGTGASALYTVSPSWNTAQLTGFFNEKNNPATVTLGMEITWILDGKNKSTQIATIEVENDLNVGDESSPTDANPDYPLPAALLLRNPVTWSSAYNMAGAAGDYDLNSDHLAIYTGDGTTHTWLKLTGSNAS